MSDGAPASLTSSLLARKGAARPAALPEDNYSPFRNDADAWRHTVATPANGDGPQTAEPAAPRLPSLFDALEQAPESDATGDSDVSVSVETESEERPEAALTQIRVQRKEPTRAAEAASPAEDIDDGASPASVATTGDDDTTDPTLATAETPAAAAVEPGEPEAGPNVVETPAQPAIDVAAANSEIRVNGEAPAVAEPSADGNAGESEVEVAAETAPAAEEAPREAELPAPAIPAEIAAAAMAGEPSPWRRHLTTFALSFLVGGALAFVGWSIYSKGGIERSPVDVKIDVPTAAVSPAAPSPATTEVAQQAPNTAPTAVAPTTALPAPLNGAEEPRLLSVRFADDGRATIVGSAAPDSDVILLDNGALLATVKADGDGIWSYLGDAALADGSHKFAVATVAGTASAKLSTATDAQTATMPQPLLPPAEPSTAPAQQPRNVTTTPLPATGDAATGGDTAAGQSRLDPAAVPLPAEKREHLSAVEPSPRYVVQLASVPTEADARRFWEKLTERDPALLGKHSLLVQAGTVAEGRTVFRVRAGPFESRKAAQRACRGFRPLIRDCLVVRRPATPS